MKKDCATCLHETLSAEDEPCCTCPVPGNPYSKWEPKDDAVNHPSHYTKGKIEVADFIADQKLNFDRGNAVKYVCRAGSKDPDKEVQDLKKAIWYIEHEIKMLGGSYDAAEKED